MARTTRSVISGEPPRTRIHRSFALQIGLLVGIWIVFGFSALASRDQTRSEATKALVNLAAAVALDISHNIELIDLALQDAATEWSNDEIRALKPSLRQLAVFDLSFQKERLGRFLIVDQFGSVLASSDDTSTEASYAQRPEFRAQIDNPSVGLYIGAAFRDPSTGDPEHTLQPPD